MASSGSIVQRFAQLSSEVIRDRGAATPMIAAKLILARGLWGIGAARFLMLGLYEQKMDRWAETMSYLKHTEPGLRAINWRGEGRRLTVDKLVTTERFAQANIPSARLIAVIGRDRTAHAHDGMFPTVSSAEELAAMLASCPDQVFVKPATGWRGQGAMGPQRREGKWWVSGAGMTDRELAERLVNSAPPSGLLLQERLRSHPALTPIGGNLGLGCLRINTALTTQGPELLFAFCKIMGSEGLVDNFADGKYGNMAAGVDLASGTLTRAFGRRQGRQYLVEPVDKHPITGVKLAGFPLPIWDDVVNLAKRAAAAFPETPLIGSDIAITEEGPRVIEIQSDWGSNMAQLTLGRGLRPLLRDTVPRLAVSEDVKQQAMRAMGLTGSTRRWRKPPRKARDDTNSFPQQQVGL